MRYQPFRVGDRWFAIDNETHDKVGEPFQTETGANAECERLELQAWRDSKPVTAFSEHLTFDTAGDVTESLLAIFDKPRAEDMTFDVRAAA